VAVRTWRQAAHANVLMSNADGPEATLARHMRSPHSGQWVRRTGAGNEPNEWEYCDCMRCTLITGESMTALSITE